MKILIIILVLLNFIFAQKTVTHIGAFKTVEEIEKIIPKIDRNLLQNKYTIKADFHVRNIISSKENNKINFIDEANTVIKTIALDEKDSGFILDHKYVLTHHPTLSDDPGKYINNLYDESGNLVFSKKLDYQLNLDNQFLLFKFQDPVDPILKIHDINGYLLSTFENVLDGEHVDIDVNNERLFRIINKPEGSALAVFNFYGHMMGDFYILNAVNHSMIAISKKYSKIYVGNGNEIIILNYQAEVIDRIQLEFDYGSYIALSPDERYLAVLNIKLQQNNFLYLLDTKNNTVIQKRNVPGLTNIHITQVSFTNNFIIIGNRLSINRKYRSFIRKLVFLNKQLEILTSFEKSIDSFNHFWSKVQPIEMERNLIIKDIFDYDILNINK